MISGVLIYYNSLNLSMVAPPGPRGGMVDTRDLKSLGLVGRAVRVRPWVPGVV